MITDNPRLAGVGQDDFLARRRVPLMRRLRVHAPSSRSISSCRALSGAEVDQEEAARHREEVEARHREEVGARRWEESEARRREESEAHHQEAAEARRWEEVEATPLVSSQLPHWRESDCL